MHKLHLILQEVMGWTNSHLYQFVVGGTYFGEPDPDDFYEVRSSRRAKLAHVASRPGARFVYEYDFGDDWKHDILVEKILPAQAATRYPVCLAGRRASSPEDCGGMWGYEELLEAIRDPHHEEHEQMLMWPGGSFDSEAFELEGINRALRRIRGVG